MSTEAIQDSSAAPASSASTAELINRVQAQVATLVKDELALARIEMTAKAKKAGLGGGLFVAAGLLATYALGLLIALAAVALALVWPAWLAVLVVLAAVLLLAAVCALVGRQALRRATPPLPTEAVDGLTADVDAVKGAVHAGRP